MAEVDEVIRAAVSAGELIIRMSEAAFRAGQGAAEITRRLIERHGGCGSQVRAEDIRSSGPARAFSVETQALADIRRAAEDAGMKFAVVEEISPGIAAVIVRDMDAELFADLCELCGAAAIPVRPGRKDENAPGKSPGLIDPETEETLLSFTVPPEKAGPFFERADQRMIMFETDSGKRTPADCLESGEMPAEAFEVRISRAAASGAKGIWTEAHKYVQMSGSGSVLTAHITMGELKALREHADESAYAAVPAGNGMQIAFSPQDRHALEQAVPALNSAKLVTKSELRGRLYKSQSRPARVVIPGSEKDKVTSLIKELGMELPHFEVIGEKVKYRESLESRMSRLCTPARDGDFRQKGMVRACVSPDEAEDFMLLAKAAHLPVRDKRTSGGAVTLMTDAAFSEKAQSLLSLGGINARFMPVQKKDPPEMSL